MDFNTECDSCIILINQVSCLQMRKRRSHGHLTLSWSPAHPPCLSFWLKINTLNPLLKPKWQNFVQIARCWRFFFNFSSKFPISRSGNYRKDDPHSFNFSPHLIMLNKTPKLSKFDEKLFWISTIANVSSKIANTFGEHQVPAVHVLPPKIAILTNVQRLSWWNSL